MPPKTEPIILAGLSLPGKIEAADSPAYKLDFAPGTFRTLKNGQREVDVIAATPEPGLRHDMMGQPYWLSFGFGPDCIIHLEHINNHAPVLIQHENHVFAVIGKVKPGSASADQTGLRMTLVFPREDRCSEEENHIIGKVEDGFLRNLSIGANVLTYRQLESADGEPPRIEAAEWTSEEVSLVAVGLINSAKTLSQKQTNINAARGDAPFTPPEKETKMPPEIEEKGTDQTAAAQLAAKLKADQTAEIEAAKKLAATEAVQAEKERHAGLMTCATKLGLDVNSPEVAAILNKSTLEAGKDLLIDMHASADESKENHVNAAHAGSSIVSDARDKLRIVAGNALDHRLIASTELKPEARMYRGMTRLEMGREMLRASGSIDHLQSRRQVAAAMIGLQAASGAMSTSDFPLLLADSANKLLRKAYDDEPRSFTEFCTQQDLPDTKTASLLQFGGASSLDDIAEGEEYKLGSATEAREQWQLSKSGKKFALTLEAIINDDLNAFARMLNFQGQLGARKQNDVVWAILTGNPNMSDSNPLFDSTHSNLVASGDGDGAPSATTIAAMRTAMGLQTGLSSSEKLNLEAEFIIVPRALYDTVEQLFSPNYQPTSASSAITPSMRSLKIITDSRLDDASPVEWYMAASPKRIDTIVYGFLQGENGPTLEERPGWDVDGIEYKIRQFFGAKAADWRGLIKNDGVA